VPDEKGASSLSGIERRVDKRTLVNVPVEITEIDAEGHPHTERTFIEDVSDFGCRFSTRGSIEKGATVAVKLLSPNGSATPDEQPHLFEVMWVARKQSGSTVGARILQGEKLANTKFPLENLAKTNGK